MEREYDYKGLFNASLDRSDLTPAAWEYLLTIVGLTNEEIGSISLLYFDIHGLNVVVNTDMEEVLIRG